MRIAIIFDNQIRPDTTGIYCLRALQELVTVEHYRPADLQRLSREGFDLYLNIDDGLRYRLPPDLHPCAWWAIDTHLDFPWYRTKGHDFDYLFAAQRDGAAALRDEGLAARWLPLACDPHIHRQHQTPKVYDVCFVGNLCPGPRSELLQLIQRRFPNNFTGRRYFSDMARTYSSSRLVFNRSIRNDVNMRVFEALASGSLLVTNDLSDNGQAELFRDGEHLVNYTEAGEMLERMAYYLEHEEERECIATAGRAAVLERHTYRHRMQTVLAALASEEMPAEHSPAPPAPTPGGVLELLTHGSPS